MRGKENVVFLPRHPDAPWIDHAAMSPTFKETLNREIFKYINK